MCFGEQSLIEQLENRRLLSTVTVTNTADSGAGSLRQATADAQMDDTIDLSAVSGTIHLLSPLDISINLTINGPTDRSLAIDGGDTVHLLDIDFGADLSLFDLTFSHGRGTLGGAIHNDGIVLMTRTTFSDNSADSGGGAIANYGFMGVTDSYFVNNSAGGGYSADGGAILSDTANLSLTEVTFASNTVTVGDSLHTPAEARGGAVAVIYGGANVENCTFYDNSVTARSWSPTGLGGGLCIDNAATFSIDNCTFARNTSEASSGSAGGGVYCGGIGAIANSIVAENNTNAQPDIYMDPSATDGGHNLITDGDGTIFTDGVNGNLVGTLATPLLAGFGTFGAHGGKAPTLALDSTSPAIDTGDVSPATTLDQRGAARIGAPDIGAFEYGATPPNDVPAMIAQDSAIAQQDSAFAQTISAHDSDADSLTINVVAKPAWLTVTDNGDGTATLTGTPTLSDGGMNQVVLTVNDGTVNSNPQAYDINVTTFRWQTVGSTLVVTGSAADDTIVVQQTDSKLSVSRNGVIHNFGSAGITRVEAYGFDGDDTITLNLHTSVAYALGGGGSDSLTGGDQNDTLSGSGGRDFIYGMAGDDRLNGFDANDRLDGGAGNDRLYGGNGNDVLVGGTGTDTLHGEAGDDALYAIDSTADQLYGDSGTNAAAYDVNDFLNDALSQIIS